MWQYALQCQNLNTTSLQILASKAHKNFYNFEKLSCLLMDLYTTSGQVTSVCYYNLQYKYVSCGTLSKITRHTKQDQIEKKHSAFHDKKKKTAASHQVLLNSLSTLCPQLAQTQFLLLMNLVLKHVSQQPPTSSKTFADIVQI